MEGLIKKVPDFNDTPESFYASYNMIRNKAGQIIYIAEYPECESGDWNLIYENYFDTNGNLIVSYENVVFLMGSALRLFMKSQIITII